MIIYVYIRWDYIISPLWIGQCWLYPHYLWFKIMFENTQFHCHIWDHPSMVFCFFPSHAIPLLSPDMDGIFTNLKSELTKAKRKLN